jgi:N-acetylmuramoyl-L-alanine amidase
VLSLGLQARGVGTGGGQPGRSGLVVLSAEGRRAVATSLANGREMVALTDLASVVPLEISEDRAAGGLAVTVNGRSILLSLSQGLASIDGRLVGLPAAPIRSERGWLVPIDFIDRALAPVSPVPIDFHRTSGLIVLGRLRVPRVVVRTDTRADVPTLTFDITPRAAHTVTQEEGRLLVRFDADALDADIAAPPAGEVLAGVRLLDDLRTVAITLGPAFSSYRTSSSVVGDSAERLTLELTPSRPTTSAAPAPSMPSPDPPAGPMPFEFARPAFQTVVIDPGHGGDEPGARGSGGLEEKTITLAVARRLKAALEGRLGLRVLLTRSGDETVGIDERAAVANHNKADLFLSLHANSSRKPTVSGVQVLVLDPGDAPPAEIGGASTGRQLLQIFGGGLREVELVPWDQAQSRHLEDSMLLAQYLQEDLSQRVTLAERPIARAPLRVLASANMPAVLVELGFVSNADDERRLGAARWQDQLAQALYESVVRFRAYRDGAARTAGGGF